MSGEPMRVLIVAENASTRFGGEAIIPYHYYRLLRVRGIDAHLVVHARTRAELQTLFPGDERIHFVEDQLLQKLFFQAGKLLPHRISEATFGLTNQLLTQRAQRGVVRRLATEKCVVHQPIPVSPRFPSLLYDLGAPVAIGPLNGGMEYPVAFRDAETGLSRALIATGRSFTDFANAIFPGKRRAAVVLVANRRTRDALPSHLHGRVIELPENAVDTTQWKPPAAASGDDTNRFVFIGRLVDWKALDVVLEALQALPQATLDIIGDGPMLAKWRKFAGSLGLAERVRFHGWLTQAQCSEHLAGCAALVLPSIYECGGAVVLEAMAMSRPVIATAWGGPLDYLDASCGILVEPSSKAALADGFAQAMRRLMESPELRASMGAAGRARLLSEFDWTRKIDRMLEIYQSMLEV